jgi:ribulose-phosphate 3-epimerase
MEMDNILDKIKKSSIKSGIAINPDTPINKLEDYINKVDLICLMGVHAGFGGQKFIEKTFDRLIELKGLINLKDSSTLIEIDGGVDNFNSQKLKSLGADILVAGSYIFKSPDINNAIDSLK